MNKIKKPNSNLFIAIKAYITKHGFGTPRSKLVRGMDADIFRQNYYTVTELKEFCDEIGISKAGLKPDLSIRIETYLRSDKIIGTHSYKPTGKPDSQFGLSLNRKVCHYKSDSKTRAFFKDHIVGFTGFSALVQKQIKERLANNESFTYGEVIEMHKQFICNKEQARASGECKVVAHSSCEYNQFSIDYAGDTTSKPHTLAEAWELVRTTVGANTYERYQQRIQEIKKIVLGQGNTHARSKSETLL